MEEDAPVQQSSRTDFVSSFFQQFDHYKKLLFKYWWIPVALVAISVEIQSRMLKKVPPLFVSVGKMIVNMKVTIPNANVNYSEPLNDFFGTQVALMQSDKVVNQVKAHLRAAHPELEPSPVEVIVSLQPKTTIFSLQASGQDPLYTQLYLQGVMDEYINLKREQLSNTSSSTQSGVIHELQQLGEEVSKSRKNLEDFRASNSVVFLQPSGGNSAADYLALQTRKLEDLKAELYTEKSLTLDESLQRLQEENASKLSVESPSKKVSQPDSNQTNAADSTNQGNFTMAGTPTYLDSFTASYVETKRTLIKLNDDLAKINAVIATNHYSEDKANARDSILKDIEHEENMLKLWQHESELQMTNRIHLLEVKVQAQENLVKESQSNVLEVSKKLSDYKALEENHQRLQVLYDQMQASLQQLEMSKNLSQESVTIYESACPSIPIPPSKLKHLIMAGLIGLVLGVGIMVFLDRLDDRPSSFNDLEKLFDLPVVGQFPQIKPNNKKEGVPILQLDDDRYPLVESYRSLRSAMLYRDSRKEYPRRIVVTSARPGEGKSMVSANFAVTLAQAGARVLLVDADLRRGTLHQNFSASATPGLSEVLSGQIAWNEAAVQTHIPNLHLIPCGAYPRHPGVLFANLAGFLEQISGQYDFYIFDTPPVMVGDDVLSLAPQMDGLIMVVRAGFTPGRMARAALDLLRVRQVNVIGLAFNGVSPKASDYHYYKFKDYYPQHPAA